MRISILLLFFIILGHCTTAQKKFGFEMGADFPSGCTIGIFSKFSPASKLEFSYGTDLKFEDSKQVHTITLNHGYYFGNLNKKWEKKLWIINTGLVYGYSDSAQKKVSSLLLNVHFSREIPLSAKWSLEPKLGIAGVLMNKVENKDEFHEVNTIPVFPVLGAKVLFCL
ncbi:hypothetical protein [Maribellus mangrovi]|uniref:hypothetical protein n=1 Tax=Maribellus mangrovi TaxID=3133146 RepID=UPI0030EF52B6